MNAYDAGKHDAEHGIKPTESVLLPRLSNGARLEYYKARRDHDRLSEQRGIGQVKFDKVGSIS